MKMIIAITQFFEKKTEKIVVETEFEKERMNDFVNHSQKGGFYFNDDFHHGLMILGRTGNESCLETKF